jgi:hypothetical protein
MKKEKKDFTQTLIGIANEEIKKGELGHPLVFYYKDNKTGMLVYNNNRNHMDKLDNLSVQIRTLIRALKNCTIGVIFEGAVTGADGCTDAMILTIEDGVTCKNIIYTMDENRNVIDINENISSVSDCPVVRFQNFYKTDYVFNNHNVEKVISKDITIRDYKSDILNIVKDVTLVTEPNLEFSFVLYKKKKSNRLFSSILNYTTSTKDIDVYFRNKKNELVSWIKYYKVENSKTNIQSEMIWVYNLHVKTNIMLYDLYEINDDRSLKVIENNLLLPKS